MSSALACGVDADRDFCIGIAGQRSSDPLFYEVGPEHADRRWAAFAHRKRVRDAFADEEATAGHTAAWHPPGQPVGFGR